MPRRARFWAGAFVALAIVRAAAGVEGVQLPKTLPALEARGSWHDTLDELSDLGIPQNWKILGPLSAESVRLFEKQLDPDKNDDWSKPVTDNMGRVFKATTWDRPKDDDGCYVDLSDIFASPPVAPLIYASTEIFSPVDGQALLWFENSGKAIVYWNNQIVLGGSVSKATNSLGVTGKKSKYEGVSNALYPVPVELKQGKNVLKIKLLKERWQQLKGWGFFARIERNDVGWHEMLLAKLKELYPEQYIANTGAQMRMHLGRLYERAGELEKAFAMYREVEAQYPKMRDAFDDAQASLKRLKDKSDSGDVVRGWSAAFGAFRTAIDNGRAYEADQAMRRFLAQFPFSDEAGLALCYRGGLRLDYAFDEAARPFFECAVSEYSRSEAVRKMGVKGLEFAKFLKPQHNRFDVENSVEASFTAITRQVQNGNRVDMTNGMKALGELLLSKPDALVRAGGTELYPRYAGLNQVAHEFLRTFNEDERKAFRAPLERGAASRYREASARREPLALEEVSQKFPGTVAAAQALNEASNLYLDRGMYERAAQTIRILRKDYAGSGLLDEKILAAKEAHALKALNQTAAEKSEGIAMYGANSQHAGAPLNAPAPVPGNVEWMRPLKPSEFQIRAQNSWSEDKIFKHFESFPIVSNGRVFAATREEIKAIDLASGRDVWSKNWNNPGYVLMDRFAGFPLTLPCAQDGKVFLRCVNPDRGSVLRCYAESDGALLWDTEKNNSLRATYMCSEPLAAYGMVYAVYFEPLDVDTSRCGILALNAQSGNVVWRRQFGSGNSGIQISEQIKESKKLQILYRITLQLGPPAAHDGMIYTSTGLSSVAALNAYTGEIHWITEYPMLRTGGVALGHSGIEYFLPRLVKCLARGPSSPVVSDSVVALAPKDCSGVLGFDRISGALLWCQEILDSRFIAGLCGNNLLAADDTVTALDMNTGRVAWEYSPDSKKLQAQPGYCGGILYLPYEDGIHRVNARDGKLVEKTKFDPMLANTAANLVVTDKHIVGVNARSVFSIGGK